MSADSRDRVTVDLRGLAPAVKAHAAARNMTLAAFARAAMVEALKQAEATRSICGPVGGLTTASRSSSR